jgi:hypothetical protein
VNSAVRANTTRTCEDFLAGVCTKR